MLDNSIKLVVLGILRIVSARPPSELDCPCHPLLIFIARTEPSKSDKCNILGTLLVLIWSLLQPVAGSFNFYDRDTNRHSSENTNEVFNLDCRLRVDSFLPFTNYLQIFVDISGHY